MWEVMGEKKGGRERARKRGAEGNRVEGAGEETKEDRTGV